MTEPAPPGLSRGRRSMTFGVVVLVVVALVVGLLVWQNNRTGLRFSARFTSSVGVYPGSDVRILGVPVGKVDSVTPQGKNVRLAMHLDPGVDVRADTYAVIVSPNLVSDRYVQLTGTYSTPKGGAKLTDGTVIGVEHTRTPVELDELTRNLTSLTDALGPKGANATGALSRLLETGAANLGTNGKKINETITRLSQSGRTLDSSKTDIFATIEQLSTFTRTLQQHNSALASANRNFASVTQTLSNDRKTFGEAIHELGTALSLVQRFVHENRGALSSNVDKLKTVAGTLADQRSSLARALRSAPLLLQNFLNAYDPNSNLLRGRANLNDITVWANGGSGAGTNSATNSDGTGSVTPLLLPPVDNSVSGSR